MRQKTTNIYTYDELSDRAKERAKEWFREGNLDYDWWDYIYEDASERASELGLDINQKPVKVTRYEPEIYFSGFYHQGSGLSFSGTWRASDMKLDQLKANCPTETELHNIGAILAELAAQDPDITGSVAAKGDTWIRTETSDAIQDQLNLEYNSPEYKALEPACCDRQDAFNKAMRDFNHWIFKRLEAEYEYLQSDESVEEAIRINEYEFDEDGRPA